MEERKASRMHKLGSLAMTEREDVNSLAFFEES